MGLLIRGSGGVSAQGWCPGCRCLVWLGQPLQPWEMQGEQSRQQLSSVPDVAVRGNTGISDAFLSQPVQRLKWWPSLDWQCCQSSPSLLCEFSKPEGTSLPEKQAATCSSLWPPYTRASGVASCWKSFPQLFPARGGGRRSLVTCQGNTAACASREGKAFRMQGILQQTQLRKCHQHAVTAVRSTGPGNSLSVPVSQAGVKGKEKTIYKSLGSFMKVPVRL